MKLLRYIKNNLLFVYTLFLLAFIPLYPKFPLVDIQGTWVYIRLEDIFIALGVVVWFVQWVRKKVVFNTPLTIPIIIFWLIGGVATLYSVIVLFPHLLNVSAKIALLHWLRRIEYLSVFFIAYSAIKTKKQLQYVGIVLLLTLFAVCLYGFGQRGYIIGWENRFPAFLTMNEEYAKGKPIQLDFGNRISSTFGGHYDLAAYLVMLIPLMGSMVFGVKKILHKFFFFTAALAGLWLLMTTSSRISFGVYLLTIIFMLIIQKQKKWIVPVVFASLLLLNFNSDLTNRFRSTITEKPVIIDQKTNEIVGTADMNGNKTVININNLGPGLNTSNTGAIPVSDEGKTTNTIEIRRKKIVGGKEVVQVESVEGNFIVRKSYAIDESFAIRMQGSWPRAIEAFKRNIFIGSGYSTISLASDNNYLRILGEVGLLGLLSFAGIFLIFFITLSKQLRDLDNKYAKSFILGISAGIFGLCINAVLIDVFEASKIAYILWMLIGISLATVRLYSNRKISYITEIKNVLSSKVAILIYMFIATFVVFSPILQNYFVADDFTWLRWAADCTKVGLADKSVVCEPVKNTYINYFITADNFFYRPGTKIFFHIMYNKFAWLNANVYHVISLLLHFGVSALIFLISEKILKRREFAALTGFLFLLLSSHAETVFWISSIGHIFTSFFILLGLYFHLLWRETKKNVFYPAVILCIVTAPLFQEFGIIAGLLILIVDFIVFRKNPKGTLGYLLPIPLYILIRSFAKSHWTGGDYSYNLSKLPFNVVGNIVGYGALVLFGSNAFVPYSWLRSTMRESLFLSSFFFTVLIILVIIVFFRRKTYPVSTKTKEVGLLSLTLFLVPLLPFLGLGNITERYAYLSSFGILLFLSYFALTFFDYFVNKKIAAVIIFCLFFLFTLYNIKELERKNNDWKTAGEITRNLLMNFNYLYVVKEKPPINPVFYFVNTPVKKGEAWVFPVGLSDALWFNFQKENLSVKTMPSIELALDAAEGSASARVFEFDKNGDIEEVSRSLTTP